MIEPLSRRQLAEKIGCTRQFIDFIFAGKRRPSPDLAARLEHETGVDRRAWLYPEEFPNPLVKNDAVPPQPQDSRV
ncbi:MAG TPA: helix-turn-helix transcriptional regulator [Acidobacteriota bacterium]|nr:helix-turn-helix transcriptional regulator [Acidobacteriota bacterium]HRV09060.1 helix-turn-helix transcriptional regulator [Acidobacteriota bacterium]